jgi:hypothetical protein
MKRKFAFLAVLGTLLALAVPASSMAVFSPPGFKFEIVGDSHGPWIKTSLGACSLAKITGQIPASESSNFIVPAPTPGSCTAGTSISISKAWTLSNNGNVVALISEPEGITFRFSSLPGCKLTGVLPLYGIWSNGLKEPWVKSGYHADSAGRLLWADDGPVHSCALSGPEPVAYVDTQTAGENTFGTSNIVNDLTYLGTPITVR